MRPLLKKFTLDPAGPANYCPVSNLSFLGKVFEREVADQLQMYLDETTLLDPYQSGVQPSYGTETAWVALKGELRQYLD